MAEAGALKQAERELHQKFPRIPQYSCVQFVVGVAIAGNQVSFQARPLQKSSSARLMLKAEQSE